MKRFLFLATLIVTVAVLNSCRKTPLEYPITYKVTKLAGDSTRGVNIKYYIKGETIRDTLHPDWNWTMEFTSLSGDYLELEAESFGMEDHIQVEILNDGAQLLQQTDASPSFQKIVNVKYTLPY